MNDPREYYYPTTAIVYLSKKKKKRITKIHSLLGMRKPISYSTPLHRDINLADAVHDLRDHVHEVSRSRYPMYRPPLLGPATHALVGLLTLFWCPVRRAQ